MVRDAGASPLVLSPLLLLVRLTLYPTRQPVQRLPYTTYLNWMSTPSLPHCNFQGVIITPLVGLL